MESERLRPSEAKKFVGKVVKLSVIDHSFYRDSKDVTAETPCIIISYGVIKLVKRDQNDHWYLNISFDVSSDDDVNSKFLDESGSTYMLSDILTIVELHE